MLVLRLFDLCHFNSIQLLYSSVVTAVLLPVILLFLCPRVALPVQEAVEQQVLRILKALYMGSPGAKPATSVAAAFGAVTAAFLRNR
jgi:hypothetical protein